MSDEKTLLPELLPAPRALDRAPPKERVHARARRLLARFRDAGATASAALISAHCTGYGVVDPLPPPPEACSTAPPDAFAAFFASASFDRSVPDPTPPVALQLRNERFEGLTVGAITVTGGTLTSSTVTERFGTHIELRIEPESASAVLLVDVALACGDATGALRYRIAYHVPTTPNDFLSVEPR